MYPTTPRIFGSGDDWRTRKLRTKEFVSTHPAIFRQIQRFAGFSCYQSCQRAIRKWTRKGFLRQAGIAK